MKELKEHWLSECKAFFLSCNRCGYQGKKGNHRCVRELKKTKKNFKTSIDIFMEDIKDYERQVKDAAGANTDGLLDEKITRFQNEIFVKLDDEDRKDVLESLQEALDDGGDI